MEHDQPERRDSPDAEDESPTPPDSAAPPPDDEPSVPEAAQDEAAAPAEPEGVTGEAEPAQEPEAAPDAVEPSPPWPTEPPAAGSADEEAWPTSAPERGEEDQADEAAWAAAAATGAAAAGEPRAPEPSASEPPPSEVEAYPASAQPAESEGEEAAARAAAVTAAHSVPDAESATGESTQCPRCGTENRPGLAFCRNCGQRLIAAGVASTVERPGTPEGTMACPRCGTHNRAGVAFCQNCGANLRGTAPGYVPPAVAAEAGAAAVAAERAGAVLGPVVLLIGMVGSDHRLLPAVPVRIGLAVRARHGLGWLRRRLLVGLPRCRRRAGRPGLLRPDGPHSVARAAPAGTRDRRLHARDAWTAPDGRPRHRAACGASG